MGPLGEMGGLGVLGEMRDTGRNGYALTIMQLKDTIARRDGVIRILESDLRAARREIKALRDVLKDAVEKYGKPGGPWNVPSEPGSWIARAKDALKEN